MRFSFASSSRPLVAFRVLVLAVFIGLSPFSSRGDQAADISAIKALLESALLGGSAEDAFITYPIDDNLDNAVNTLDSTLRDIAYIPNSGGGTAFWNIYLNRILTGNTSAVPAAQQGGNVLGFLRLLVDASTNTANQVDMSWTNALPALVSASTNLNLFFDGVRDMVSELQTFGYQMADFFDYNPGSNLNDIRSDTADIASIMSSYVAQWDDAYDPDDESWRVQLTYDGGLGDRIGEIAGSISDSNEDTVDALNGIRDLLRMISTNVAATHDDIYGASQEQSNIADVATDGADDYDYAVDSASSDIEYTLITNEPSFAVHYTQNPLDPLVNAVDFSQTMRSKLPDMSIVQTDSRVYLFKTEWDREHLLTRPGGSSRSGSGLGQGLSEISFDLSGSDPHVPNELLSYASTAMAWAWNLAAVVTAFYLFRQFWDWVASWRV